MKNKHQKDMQSKTKVEGRDKIDTEVLKDQLARALADYDNLRKRHDEEKKQMYLLALVSVVSKILPVLDNLRAAQIHVEDSGIAMIISEFEQILTEEGFVEIKVQAGDEFDHDAHEVVEVEKTDKKENNSKVSEMTLTGWRLKEGPIIRHTKVKVYKYE